MTARPIFRRIFLFLILALPCLGGYGAETRDEDLQRVFIEGARHLEAGNFAVAAGIFRSLLDRTQSPRVRLELARALFHLQQYDEAKRLFRGVLLEQNTPWEVRDSIDHFMREVDARVGYLRFSISATSDSNPRNLSSQKEFVVAGVRLRYTPPEDNRRVTGLRYLVQAYRPLSTAPGLAAYLVGSLFDYPGHSVDRMTADMGLFARSGGDARLSVKTGIELGTFGERLLYRMPYMSVLPVLWETERGQIGAELKAGRVDFPDAGYLDATLTSATLTAGRRISETAILSLAGGLDHSRAREAPYSYLGRRFAPALALLLPGSALMIKGSLAFESRSYGDIDPLFGERRRDLKRRIDAALTNKEWRWLNFTPSLVFSVEQNRSSLEFHAYRKVNLSLHLE